MEQKRQKIILVVLISVITIVFIAGGFSDKIFNFASQPHDGLFGGSPLGDESAPAEGQNLCALKISCEAIIPEMSRLDEAKAEIVPEGGIIFEGEVSFNEGETVFDLLERTLKRENIHFDFSTFPGTESIYIKGIGNIYEFDCGENSGWLFKLNGEYPQTDSKSIPLSEGDRVEFSYSVDIMGDLGFSEMQ